MNYHDEVNEELEELLPLEDIDAWQERIDNMINVEMCNDEDDRKLPIILAGEIAHSILEGAWEDETQILDDYGRYYMEDEFELDQQFCN